MQGAANSLTGRTVSAGYLKAIFGGALALGVNKSDLLAVSGLTPSSLENSPRSFPANALLAILDKVARHTKNPAIGIVIGQGVRPVRQIDVIYATTFCDDLLEATKINFAYQPLIQEIGQTRLEIDGEEARGVWTPHVEDARIRYLVETIFTSYASIVRWMMWSETPIIKSLNFRHSAPKDTSIYEDVFGDRVRFDAPQDALILQTSDLYKKIPSRNPDMLGRLKLKLDQMLVSLNEPGSASGECKALVTQALGSSPVSIKNICAQMNMSERHLRRRLTEEGTSFRELLEQSRKEAADIFMADRKMSLSEIAQALGFNDQSAFSRAFKTWHEQTPRAFRDAQFSAAEN